MVSGLPDGRRSGVSGRVNASNGSAAANLSINVGLVWVAVEDDAGRTLEAAPIAMTSSVANGVRCSDRPDDRTLADVPGRSFSVGCDVFVDGAELTRLTRALPDGGVRPQ